MASSDLNVLLDMGFDKERAELSVKKTGGLQGALQWLEDNQDKPIEDLRSASKPVEDDETDPLVEPAALKDGEVARSLVCNDCGKRFRSTAQAEFHATKTEHQDFSESTEEIKPLTEEEKKEKLAELKARAIERKALKEKADMAERKANEKIQKKNTQDLEQIKDDMEKKERIKEAKAKRQEKLDDVAAKQRIKDKIAADKEERRLKAEKQKAEREGRAPPEEPVAAPPVTASKPKATATEARLRLQTPGGNVLKTFAAETTLFEVAAVLEADGTTVTSFTMTFPKKVFEGPVDFSKTLREAGCAPSAVLIVQ